MFKFLKPCLDCGELSEGSRCPKHRRVWATRTKPGRRGISQTAWRRLVRVVKDRDGRRCVVCQSPHELEIHHRNGNHADNRLVNLETRCSDCHDDAHRAA